MLGSLRFENFFYFRVLALGAAQAALDSRQGFHFGPIVSGRMDGFSAARRQVIDFAENSLRGSA
jgi:hypothetical protein